MRGDAGGGPPSPSPVGISRVHRILAAESEGLTGPRARHGARPMWGRSVQGGEGLLGLQQGSGDSLASAAGAALLLVLGTQDEGTSSARVRGV